jgi:hypothetical protein
MANPDMKNRIKVVIEPVIVPGDPVGEVPGNAPFGGKIAQGEE